MGSRMCFTTLRVLSAIFRTMNLLVIAILWQKKNKWPTCLLAIYFFLRVVTLKSKKNEYRDNKPNTPTVLEKFPALQKHTFGKFIPCFGRAIIKTMWAIKWFGLSCRYIVELNYCCHTYMGYKRKDYSASACCKGRTRPFLVGEVRSSDPRDEGPDVISLQAINRSKRCLSSSLPYPKRS